MIRLFYNEIIKAFFKRRTYISFLLITFLIPIIVYAIDYGAVSLQNKIYFGAFDVIEKILFSSKYLNINFILFFLKFYNMKNISDQECRGR